VDSDYSITQLSEDLTMPVQPRPERVIHVDIDYIYDDDPAQQNENLGKLLDRVKRMKVSTVYLQAYSDPDGNGAADSVYFPNRHIPVKADLFSRVSWQLRTRAGVSVYAWMPLLAFELPSDHRLATHLVESFNQQAAGDRYPRLTPYDPEVRRLISEIYEDLAKSTLFDGILFHDDATLDDFEDVSDWALGYYSKAWGLAESLPEFLERIRSDPDLFNKWTHHKTRLLTEFSLELANRVRQYQPDLKTARNLYAEVALNPDAEEWYAQSLPNFLQNYDYTAVMAMPYMENAEQPMAWLKNLVSEITKQPNALHKTVFELQSFDWRNGTSIDSVELGEQMKMLQLQQALNFGYYPDDFHNDVPSHQVIRPFMSLQDFPFTKH
ncbi:MAG: poly-beta-1,6-N-acetyl-D-glucosamine N-deacetylase PgaB, partial [Gallionella sp.]